MFSKQCYFLGENQSYDYFQRLRVWKCVSSRRGYKISDNFWQQKPLKWPRSLFDLEVPVWGTTVGRLRRQSAFCYASCSHGQQRRPPKPALGLPMPVTCLGDRHERDQSMNLEQVCAIGGPAAALCQLWKRGWRLEGGAPQPCRAAHRPTANARASRPAPRSPAQATRAAGPKLRS